MCQDLPVGPGWGRLGLFQARVSPLKEGDETYALAIQPLTDAVTLCSARQMPPPQPQIKVPFLPLPIPPNVFSACLKIN